MVYGGLGCGDRAQILDQETVAYLRSLDCKSIEQATRIRARFAAGDTVEITTRAMQGLAAVVERIEGRRARILIDFLGSRRSIVIDAESPPTIRCYC